MKWSRTIALNQPLNDVRRLSGAPQQDWQEFLRRQEDAAHARGRREGEKALNEQLIQQRNEIAELQNGILTSLQRAIPEVVDATEGAVIRLALEASQKIVAGLPITIELVEAVVREALQEVKDGAEVVVTLHPQDLDLLQKAKSAVLEGTPEIGSLKLVASTQLARGGCQVQTRFGLIDARREVKFEQLARSLSL